MPILSIIIPVYNAEAYLNTTLDSIKKQTFSDFECILVNDGSMDNSGFICDKFAEMDNRFVVIHQNNGGVSCARNEGLKNAGGDYIGFVDADDYIEADMYENLICAMQKYNVDIATCGVIHEKVLNKLNSFKPNCDFKIYSSPIDLFYNTSFEIDVLWNKIFKKEIIAVFFPF